jgi:hypothetical protein
MPRVPFALALAVAALPACSEYEYYKKEGNDVFYQEPAGEVDILLVVDNSCSMDPYQAKVSENFDSFLSYLEEAQVEYHIGVVTTTVEVPEPYPEYGCPASEVNQIPDGGSLVGGAWITNDTQNKETLFDTMVSVGVCGNGAEMGLESAYRALTPPISIEENLGFLRDDAYLSMIFVSDEEDASPLPVNDYINAYRDVKGQRERDVFNASALVVLDEQECAAEVASGSSLGSRYVDVAEQNDGVMASICADDFADILTEISLRSSRLLDSFTLTKLPAVNTLEVYVLPEGSTEEEADANEAIPCDAGVWSYTTTGEGDELKGVIVFDRAQMPAAQSKIIVRYDYGDGDPAGFCTDGSGADTASEG